MEVFIWLVQALTQKQSSADPLSNESVDIVVDMLMALIIAFLATLGVG